MKIIAHRGYWLNKKEQNTLKSFQRAFDNGFGVETDIRDYRGKLVIAHDVARAADIPAEKLFRLFARASSQQILALNIKSNGLQSLVKTLLLRFQIKYYFTFDASIPDALTYIQKKIKFFTRQSDLEIQPHLLPLAKGVWLDSFHSNWFNRNLIEKHLQAGKNVCIVSPELQKRAHEPVWRMLSHLNKRYGQQLSLCTDWPKEAKQFFS